MSLFGNPKCPSCGGKTVRTGYSFPYPQLRCIPCYRQSIEREELEKRNRSLEHRINKLESEVSSESKVSYET